MFTFVKDESGATAVEYGVITSLMFALIMTAWGGVFFKIADAFDVVVNTLSVAQIRGRFGFDGVIKENSAGSRDDLKDQNKLVANNNNYELALAA